MKRKASQHNKFLQIITIPLRALCKARDFYVNIMMDCASRNAIGLQGSAQAPALPRSFSASSARSVDSEDNRELIRNSSSRVDYAYLNQEMRMRTDSAGGPRAMPPRSITVTMGRIDEERPCCYFLEDINNIRNSMRNELKYPRSKSYTVARSPF